ncbi:MAG: hypothetical protein IT338_17020 [Thermomicrobiales bacterium]|nr:hypothetical protein [Thermomicrobiales bacterium]
MTRVRRAAVDGAPLAGLVVEITPEPAPAEREAILVALQAMLAASAGKEEQPLSPWAAAGRREALSRWRSGSPVRWEHGYDRAATW